MLKNGKLINPEVRIENTNRCNAMCVMCARDKMTRKQGVMSMNHFKKLADQAADLGAEMVSIFGFGEPLMDDFLSDKVTYVSRVKKLQTNITTNASRLTIDRAWPLLDAGLTHIRFSFHGINPDHYEETMKGLVYTDTVRNIGNFIAMRDKRGYDTKIHLTFIPMHKERIESIVRIWGNQVDYLEIWKPHNWCHRKEFRGRTDERKQTCGRPFAGPVQVQWDGKVIPCCFLTNAELVMGDTHKKSLLEILQGTQYELLQKAHRNGSKGDLPCLDCDQLNVVWDSPLLYSNRDVNMRLNTTSSMKYQMTEG